VDSQARVQLDDAGVRLVEPVRNGLQITGWAEVR
jgi:hypothetical protein